MVQFSHIILNKLLQSKKELQKSVYSSTIQIIGTILWNKTQIIQINRFFLNYR